jgi:glutathione-specific gamma-glutamylcyclotransferase
MMVSAPYWVFAYGSLIWDPGFPFIDRHRAVVHGYHRRFCLYSHRYRGTPELPGLVLGLDRGGCCHGVAYRVAAEEAASVRDYLWAREMSNNAYRPVIVPVRLPEGEKVAAQTFVISPAHPQYAGRLPPDLTARLIATSHGERGSNQAYLENTAEHLIALGIHDPAMQRLVRQVHQLIAVEGTVARPPVPDVSPKGF